MSKFHIIVVRNVDIISHFTAYAMNVGSGSCQGFKACANITLGAFFTFSCRLYLRFRLKFAIYNTQDTFTIGAKSCLQSSACHDNQGKNVAMIIQDNSCLGCYSCALNNKGIFTGFSQHHFFVAQLIGTLIIHFKQLVTGDVTGNVSIGSDSCGDFYACSKSKAGERVCCVFHCCALHCC